MRNAEFGIEAARHGAGEQCSSLCAALPSPRRGKGDRSACPAGMRWMRSPSAAPASPRKGKLSAQLTDEVPERSEDSCGSAPKTARKSLRREARIPPARRAGCPHPAAVVRSVTSGAIWGSLPTWGVARSKTERKRRICTFALFPFLSQIFDLKTVYPACFSNQSVISCRRRSRCLGLPERLSSWFSPWKRQSRVSTPRSMRLAAICKPCSRGQR